MTTTTIILIKKELVNILHSLITKISNPSLHFPGIARITLGKKRCNIIYFLKENIKLDTTYLLKNSHYYASVLYGYSGFT